MKCINCNATGLINENKVCLECKGFGVISGDEEAPRISHVRIVVEKPKKTKNK
jgi:UTP-glucose-1-phosphate uridylyltransferase